MINPFISAVDWWSYYSYWNG